MQGNFAGFVLGALNLGRLGTLLASYGWDARPAADGSHRIRAVAGPLELVATANPTSLGLTFTTAPPARPNSAE